MKNDDNALHEQSFVDIHKGHHGNEPGSFGCHELLDRTSIIADQIDALLLSHPACIHNPEWQKLAHIAFSTLSELYQQIGNVHLSSDSASTNTEPIPTIQSENPSSEGDKMDIRDLINFEPSSDNHEESQLFFNSAHKIIMDPHSSRAQRLTAIRVFKQALGYEAEANQQDLDLYTFGAWNGRSDMNQNSNATD